MATAQNKTSQAKSNTLTITPPMIAAAVVILIILVVAIVHGVNNARASSPAPMDQSTVQAHESAKKNNPNLN